MNKKFILIGFFIILVASFIFAAHTITTSDGGTSFSPLEDVGFVYNITVNNTESGAMSNITQVNITFPSSFIFLFGSNGTTAGGITFTNTSTVLTWNHTTDLVTNNSWSFFWFNITATTPGNYNLTITTTNNSAISQINSSITVIINDTTVPEVSASNFTTPISNGNYSQLLVLNMSIFDNGVIQSVWFNITNATSGVQNATYVASNPTGGYWNFTINTTYFNNGLYNITAYVNDTYNNQNNTAYVSKVRFENTIPTISSFSCSPASVSIRATTTCACTGADTGGSGLITTSFEINPTTALTGTFTETCTVTDRAGNSASATTDYTVTGAPTTSSGSSGSSTTTTWSMTYKVSEESFVEGYTKSLAVKDRAQVTIDSEDHYVGILELTSTQAIIEIASVPVQVTLDVGEDAKIDVNDDNIYDLYVILNGIASNKADITIKKLSEAIPEGEEESVATTGEITTPTDEEEVKPINYTWWSIVIVVIILIVLIIIFLGYKFKKK